MAEENQKAKDESRDIDVETKTVGEFVRELSEDRFLIPTFQREFEWDRNRLKLLWDSIFRFYPIGSILYWVTNERLPLHRRIGGYVLPHSSEQIDSLFHRFNYILDGQQRATSLLLTLEGKNSEGEEADYTLYLDATVSDGEEDSWKKRFLFEDEVRKRQGQLASDFVFRVRDIAHWGLGDYGKVMQRPGFNATVEKNLERMSDVFAKYDISLIKIQGADVDEVCEIFERINQQGKKLDPADIVVARTYRTGEQPFYLRDKFDQVYKEIGNTRFKNLDDFLIVQMIAMHIRKSLAGGWLPKAGGESEVGITLSQMGGVTPERIEALWSDCLEAIKDTIQFVATTKVRGTNILPFGYLLLPLTYYFFRSKKPNRQIARQWFWSVALGRESYRHANQVYEDCRLFDEFERTGRMDLELTISSTKLVESRYRAADAFSRAVLAFMAFQEPKDFEDPSAEVLDDVYLALSHVAHLHHIYPTNFLKRYDIPPELRDSLMNICYLRAKTHGPIKDQSPLEYFRNYESRDFDRILESHMIRRHCIDRTSFEPQDYRDFLAARAEIFIRRLEAALPDVKVRS